MKWKTNSETILKFEFVTLRWIQIYFDAQLNVKKKRIGKVFQSPP